jgi:hypothetical protein
VAHDLVAPARAEPPGQVDRLRHDEAAVCRIEEHVHFRRQQARFVLLDHDPEAPGLQQHQGADRVNADAADELLRIHGVEVVLAPLVD